MIKATLRKKYKLFNTLLICFISLLCIFIIWHFNDKYAQKINFIPKVNKASKELIEEPINNQALEFSNHPVNKDSSKQDTNQLKSSQISSVEYKLPINLKNISDYQAILLAFNRLIINFYNDKDISIEAYFLQNQPLPEKFKFIYQEFIDYNHHFILTASPEYKEIFPKKNQSFLKKFISIIKRNDNYNLKILSKEKLAMKLAELEEFYYTYLQINMN